MYQIWGPRYIFPHVLGLSARRLVLERGGLSTFGYFFSLGLRLQQFCYLMICLSFQQPNNKKQLFLLALLQPRSWLL